MSNNDSKFGEKVRYFRTKKGWKQEVLAAEAGLNQSEISKIENGHVKGLKEDTIRKVANALELQPEALARGTTFAALFGQSPILPFGTVDQGPPLISYFASALTGLTNEQETEIKDLDQKVDEICRNYASYPIALYRPRLKTSPKDNPDVPAREVYEIDQERVATADLIILAAIFPSLGAGMELQLALQSCSSVILLKKSGQPLSRMVLGCPARLEIIEYNGLAELENKIVETIDHLLPFFAEFRFSHPQSANVSDELEFGKRMQQLREQRKLSHSDLARIVGVGTACIEALEAKSERITNPSLQMLRRIAKALYTSESYLISGQQSLDSTFLEHSEALRNLADEINMPVGDLNQLWNGHFEQYKYELSIPGVENRAEIGDKKYWVKRYEQFKKERAKGKKLF
jgi:transcriptional regulator with XRE-family HTH domain